MFIQAAKFDSLFDPFCVFPCVSTMLDDRGKPAHRLLLLLFVCSSAYFEFYQLDLRETVRSLVFKLPSFSYSTEFHKEARSFTKGFLTPFVFSPASRLCLTTGEKLTHWLLLLLFVCSSAYFALYQRESARNCSVFGLQTSVFLTPFVFSPRGEKPTHWLLLWLFVCSSAYFEFHQRRFARNCSVFGCSISFI